MKISDIPFYDRPGERLKKYGAGVLSDYELLAVILEKLKMRRFWSFPLEF